MGRDQEVFDAIRRFLRGPSEAAVLGLPVAIFVRCGNQKNSIWEEKELEWSWGVTSKRWPPQLTVISSAACKTCFFKKPEYPLNPRMSTPSKDMKTLFCITPGLLLQQGILWTHFWKYCWKHQLKTHYLPLLWRSSQTFFAILLWQLRYDKKVLSTVGIIE